MLTQLVLPAECLRQVDSFAATMFAVAALESVTGSLPVLGVALVSAVLMMAVWEQAVLQRQRRGLPGHGLVWPFVGKIGEMVKSPYYFYEELATAGRIAWTSIGGRYARHI